MLIGSLETDLDSYNGIKKRIDDSYLLNQPLWQVYQTEANIDNMLESGSMSLYGWNTNQPFGGSQQFYFNRTRPMINMVTGYQRSNRKSTVVVPQEGGDQDTADQWTKILMTTYKNERVYNTISDAFHKGACISGMNMLHVYLDFTDDPIFGDLKVGNYDYNQYYIDPYFRNLDLSDCNFVWIRNFLTHRQAASMIPDQYEEIMALSGGMRKLGHDGRFQYLPEAYGIGNINRVTYDEYYYRDYRERIDIIDKVTGERLEVTNESPDYVKHFLQHNPRVYKETKQVPTVRLAIMINDRVFFDGPQPLNIDKYCFIPIVGYYNSSLPFFYNRIQGIARSLRDPQMLLNRRIILSLNLIESVANSGWIFKENAVIDIKHLFQPGQGLVIPLKDDAQMTDIQQIQPPQIPPSFFQMQDSLGNEFHLCTGISEENMGFNTGEDKSGYRAALQQGAGLVNLRPIFDRLDDSQNLLGEICMDVMRANYGPSKIERMLEGEQASPLFYNKAFGKYHCAVEAGFATETQKQMEFLQALDLFERGILKDAEYVLEKSTMQGKTDLIERQKQQMQQAQQQQQQQMQIQMQEIQSRSKLSESMAYSQQASGNERNSRVEENRALAIEKIAESRKQEEEAFLNKIKIIKEIESLDIAHITELLSAINNLKEADQKDEDIKKEVNPLL